MFGQYIPFAIVKRTKYPVSPRPSYTPACCSPAGTRSLLKERTGIEMPHGPSALSLATLRLAQNRRQAASGTSQATKQRFLKDPSPKMSVLFHISQHRRCTTIIYTCKRFLLSKKFQETHGLVSIIMYLQWLESPFLHPVAPIPH